MLLLLFNLLHLLCTVRNGILKPKQSNVTMKNTRDKVLEALASLQSASINQLAQEVKVNPITIRHHLNNLEAEGLISHVEVRHGVGRPRLVYRLTELGSQRFPVSFMRLTGNLLDSIESIYGPDAPRQALEMVGKTMAEFYRENLPVGSTEDRLNQLSSLMAQEGFNLEWRLRDNLVTIRNTNCPYHQLSRTHPEVCQLDHTLFSRLLEKDLDFQGCISGDKSECIFQFEV